MRTGRPKPPPPNIAAKLHERARTGPVAAMAAADVPALGIIEPGGPLVQLGIRRREPGPRDVVIEIQFCGLCPCDVHTGRGGWGPRRLPLVPGHQVIGLISAAGSEVDEADLGLRVGVGAAVDSCGQCRPCRAGQEEDCTAPVRTFGAHDPRTGEYTQGGYATRIVVDRDYVLRIPQALDAAGAAGLLCAGSRAYAALLRHRVGPGTTVGVLGAGGAGEIAVKMAAAMGAQVTMPGPGGAERAPAVATGAQNLVDTLEGAALRAAGESLDLRFDTVPDPQQTGGTGSLVGSMAQTQQMLDFCATHGIGCRIELVGAKDINAAWDRMAAGNADPGLVLDAATLGRMQTERQMEGS